MEVILHTSHPTEIEELQFKKTIFSIEESLQQEQRIELVQIHSIIELVQKFSLV